MVDYPPVTGRSVDYRASPCGDPYVSAYHHDISGLDIGEVIDPGVAAYAPPAGGGDVALVYAYLV